MYIAYVVVNGEKYFCCTGNTKRMALTGALFNLRVIGRDDLDVRVTRQIAMPERTFEELEG